MRFLEKRRDIKLSDRLRDKEIEMADSQKTYHWIDKLNGNKIIYKVHEDVYSNI